MLDKEIHYPVTRKSNVTEDFHGTMVTDPYRWLEDHQLPEVKEWVVQQNKVTDQFFDEEGRQEIYNKIESIFDYTRYSIPVMREDRYYYTKNEGLQSQPPYYYRDGVNGDEIQFFDPNTLSDDGTTAVVQAFYSDDGKFVVFSISVHGSDWQYLRTFNIETREFLPETIENIKFSAAVSWKKDNSGFYYSARVGKDEGAGGSKLWWHALYTDQKEDSLVFEYEDETFDIWSNIREDRYLLAFLFNSTMPENLVFVKDLVNGGDFKPIIEELKFQYVDLGVKDGYVYFRTNENAGFQKVIRINLNNFDDRKEIIPEDEFVLSSAPIVNNHIITVYNKDVKHVVKKFSLEGDFLGEIDLPDIGSVFADGRRTQKLLFLMFTSFVQPGTIYYYNFETNELNPFHPIEIPIEEEIITEQVFYSSKDGTQIPMYILHKKFTELNGNQPTLLYGYGGFNISLTPGFSIRAISWLEMGGTFAIANLRGGGEYGKKWHEAGILENKQNVFDDFISAGEWLIENKVTNSKKLGIAGGSNGGLLVGACAMQRPDLFGGVACAVGVLDMLRYHKYTIGRYWVPEYGNPEDPEHFQFLYKYSPLHNVKDAEYPPMLVYTADTDDRVDPAHSLKFAAELQEKGNGGPLLLRVIVKAGHGFGKPVKKQIEDLSYELGFLKQALQM